MELNVTDYLDNVDLWYVSNSVNNLGDNAAQITWARALEAADDYQWVTDENQEEVIEYFLGYGAWNREELESSGNRGLSAMICQEIASEIREFSNDGWDTDSWNWDEYEEAAHNGQLRGNLFKHEDDIYFQFGN